MRFNLIRIILSPGTTPASLSGRNGQLKIRYIIPP